jgi:hypothetical protein
VRRQFMDRRRMLSVVGALVAVGLFGARAGAADTKAAKNPPCVCCGEACKCKTCVCEARSAHGCDCCGKHCCTTKAARPTEPAASCCRHAKATKAADAQKASTCCGESCRCPVCRCESNSKRDATTKPECAGCGEMCGCPVCTCETTAK